MRSHRDRWNEHDVPCLRQFERSEPFADALGEGVPAEKKERNVGPQRKRHRRELFLRQSQPPQAVQDRERGCAIGAAAALPPADPYVLFAVEDVAPGPTAPRWEDACAAHDE